MRKLIFILLAVFISTAANSQNKNTTTATEPYNFRSNPNYTYEMGLYDIYKTKQADIVMLGNSITHGVKWNELLGAKR